MIMTEKELSILGDAYQRRSEEIRERISAVLIGVLYAY